MNTKLSQLAAFMLLSTTAWATSPLPTVIQRLEGSYTEYTPIPFYSENGIKFSEDKSTLKIESVDFFTAKLNIEIADSTGHGCGVEGIAKSVKDVLVFTESEGLEDGKTCKLIIKDDADALRLEDVDGQCRKLYCGARAGLETEFSYNSRKYTDGKSATTLEPNPGTKLCFKRFYDTAHRKKNPKQIVGSLNVEVTANDGGNYFTIGATNVGDFETDDVKNFSGGGYCSVLDTAKAKCHLDADAGGFTLQNNKDGSVFLKVAKHMRLTLGDDSEDDEISLDLSGKDKDNNLFKLYPTVCYTQPAK